MNKKINVMVEKAINERRASKDALTNRIERAKAEIAAAEQSMEKATAADNENAYTTAADKRRFNENIVNVCEDKLAEMNSEQEFNKMLDTIKADAEESIKAAEKKVACLVSELYAVCDEIDAEVKGYNDLIVRWSAESGRSAFDKTISSSASSNEMFFLKRMLRQRKNAIGRTHKNAAIYNDVRG